MRASAPRAAWDQGGIDRARELAGIFAAVGVVSLVGMRFEPFSLVSTTKGQCYAAASGDAESAAWCEPDASVTYSGHRLVIGGQAFGFLGEPGHPMNEPLLREYDTGLCVGWSPSGHGHVDFCLHPNANGFSIVPVWASSSDAGFIREGLMMAGQLALSVALPLAGVNVAQALGSSILGPSLSAAYPALPGLLGNVAIGTAFSGGDIAGAIKGTALSYFGGMSGGVVGGGVTDATGIDLLGEAASAATKAAISGGNVDQAIAFSLVQNGAQKMQDFFTTDPVPNNTADSSNFASTEFYDTGSPLLPIDYSVIADASNTNQYNFSASGDVVVSEIVPNYFSDPTVDPIPSASAYDGWPQTDPLFPQNVESPPASAFYTDIPTVDVLPVSASGPGVSLNQITAAALAALQVVNAFKSGGSRVQNPTTANTAASASTGMIVSRTATGGVTAGKPAVGVATITSDGGMIVNNGNGTFDYVSPSGQRTTRTYSTQSAGGVSSVSSGAFGIDSKTLMIVGGIGLAALLLSKR
ncbi:hypothetical protein [Fluviibacter sp.]